MSPTSDVLAAVGGWVLLTAAPAGGAAIDQVAIASGMASIATAVLLWGIFGYRNGRGQALRRAADASARVTGLPSWAALPLSLGAGALLLALLGMYWDISLHIDNGRDPGPLANPAHYLILVGLYGVFASGCLAVALPERRPGPAAIRITRDWHAPVGGVMILACGAFALVGFPLDDVWHRLFGQDVTLWGPTHLMLFGGAGLTMIGQAILAAEGMHAKGLRTDSLRDAQWLVALRRVGIVGGLLVGLSTFQGEFDFGVAQFRMIFHPMLVALAAGMALVAARVWIGRGGAIAAALMFLVVRGGVGLIVHVVFGETWPAQPEYLVEALLVEGAAILLGRERPLLLGAVSGVLIGTIGMAAEWGWTQVAFMLPWTGGVWPDALIVAPIAGVAGGLLGGLLGSGLRFRLPPPAQARAAALGAFALIAALTAVGLSTTAPRGLTADVSLHPVAMAGSPDRHVEGTIALHPADVTDDAAWVTVTSWQGGGEVVQRLRRLRQGVYETVRPVPASGDWKSLIRIQNGRRLQAAALYLPADPAIPGAREVPATSGTRTFLADRRLLQRERKDDVPAWLWTVACLTVLGFAIIFVITLSWGLARVARRSGEAAVPPEGTDPEPAPHQTRTAGRPGRPLTGAA